MANFCLARLAVPLLLLAATLASIPAFAQVDFSGEWAVRFHEDQPDRGPGPEIGDYLGLPINAAARARAHVGLGLLFWSWGLLAAAILPTLFSFIASYQAFEHQKEVAFEYYMNDNEQIRAQGHWALSTRYVTYIAGGCFVAALILTLVFAIKNVEHASATIKTNQEDFVRDENGRVTHDPNREQKGVEPSRPIRVHQPNRLVEPNNTPPVKPPSQGKNNGK